LMEKLLKICLWVNMVLGKKLWKRKSEKTQFHASLLGNGFNIFQFRTTIQVMILNDDLRNLKLSYLN
jgi:hypothetical protein